MATLGRCLSEKTVACVNAGHLGVFTTSDLALLSCRKPDLAFAQTLSKVTKAGYLRKVGRGLYINPLSPPNKIGTLERVARLIRPYDFMYVSLETELSRAGWISQVQFGYLTVMTSGRSGVHRTDFGTIEFTHTKKDPFEIMDCLYFDSEIGYFRARPELALRDLRRVGRNIHMIEDEVLNA